MRRRISPEAVEIGMYVRSFGGSWFDHPFWIPRFVVKDTAALTRIHQSGVPYVEIDETLGAPASRLPKRPLPDERPAPVARRRAPAAPLVQRSAAGGVQQREAAAVAARAKIAVRDMMDSVRLGDAVRHDKVAKVVDDISDCVERSPQTLLTVLRLKKKDEYTYMHSVAVCALMINTARFLGKSDAELREYGLAGLLHDIGKMEVPDVLLNKPGRLTISEFARVQDHAGLGHALLSKTEGVPPMALDVCLLHHERMDGSGYPRRLTQENIPPAARIGAICDVYDALTSVRVYKGAWKPEQAMAAMWSWDGQFDRALLFAFMQSIGVFAPGMVVRLRSNRIGVVLEPRPRQTRARVCAFFDAVYRLPVEPVEVTISDTLAGDGIVAPVDPQEWGISPQTIARLPKRAN